MRKKLVILGIDHGHYRAIIKAAAKRDDVEVAAVAQEGPPYADEVAAEVGARAYRSYEQCLNEESPDVVAAVMYNGARGAWVAEALRRGLPVISDKPLCTTLADLEAIREAYQESGAPFCTMLTCRNVPVYVAMRAALRSGEIGEVLAIEGCRYYPLDRRTRPDWMFDSEKYGGPGLDILMHDYDLARWSSGIDWNDIVLDESRTGRCQDRDFSDVALLVGHDDGRLLTLSMLWHSPGGYDRRLAIYGTRGLIEVPITGDAVLKDESGEVRKLPVAEVPDFAEQFFRALLDGDVDLPISGDESLAVTENMLRAGRLPR